MRHAAAALLAAALVAAGCGGGDDDDDEASSSRSPAPTIGFIYVGSTADRGYNQAVFEGTKAIRKAFPRARLIQRENVPESPAAEKTMEELIDRGATIVLATSFGHLEPALNVAARHPDVTFLHQGGLESATNLGTYFGTIWEAQYAAGQAAGLATRSDRFGYVAAFPIAQALLGINAYHLGARSVNRKVVTEVVFTSDWCDEAKQGRAARGLLERGADVLAQHQDCTRAVIREAARAGAKATGYHVDGAPIAREAVLTGSEWNWGPLYVKIVRSVLDGSFSASPYAGRYRAGAHDGAVRLGAFGPAMAKRNRRRVRATFERIRSGELRPFDGPIRDQRGNVRIRGRQPGLTELEETDYLAEGILGSLPAK